MSMIMEEYERRSNMGLDRIPNKFLCSQHIKDDSIRKFIDRRSMLGYCDYCERDKKVITLEDVLFYIMDGVKFLYTEPVEFMAYDGSEGGYQGTTYYIDDVLFDHLELEIDDNQLFRDIEGSLDYTKLWADETMYYDSKADIMMYEWDYFKKVVKHRARYLFASSTKLESEEYRVNPFQILENIGRMCRTYKLVHPLDKGTKFYRCRQHDTATIILSVEQICAPPQQYVLSPNRMSPAGISMFYGAFNEATAFKETLDLSNTLQPKYTSAVFATKRDLKVIDLSLLPKIPSPFEQRKRKDYYPLIFLSDFVRDLSAPIERDGRVHIEYVPTQIITEYFRYTFSEYKNGENKIDGIIYPSARNKGEKACVLFLDHEESIEELEFDPALLKRGNVKKVVL